MFLIRNIPYEARLFKMKISRHIKTVKDARLKDHYYTYIFGMPKQCKTMGKAKIHSGTPTAKTTAPDPQ